MVLVGFEGFWRILSHLVMGEGPRSTLGRANGLFVLTLVEKDNRFHPQLMKELHEHFDVIER